MTPELKMLVIAFAAGYEYGHNDTVEACYSGGDEYAKDVVEEMIKDGTFDRELEL